MPRHTAAKAPTDIDRQIGDRVRKARIAAGWSQEMLGNQLGLTFQQVQKYEKGSNRISAARLWTVSRVLKVDLMWFFEGLDRAALEPPDDVGQPPPPATTPNAVPSRRWRSSRRSAASGKADSRK